MCVCECLCAHAHACERETKRRDKEEEEERDGSGSCVLFSLMFGCPLFKRAGICPKLAFTEQGHTQRSMREYVHACT